MPQNDDVRSAWERLLESERSLQAAVPGAILVGGTAAALHAGHRLSTDGDHVLGDLRERFEEVVATLERLPGWRTERLRRPVLILGDLDGSPSGVRQLRRTKPLETEQISGLVVPSLPEMARIKGWLLVDRGTTRDYLDTVVLLEKLGEEAAIAAFRSFDEIYVRGPGAAPALIELVAALARAGVEASDARELRTYKGLRPPWDNMTYVCERGRVWGAVLCAAYLRSDQGTRS